MPGHSPTMRARPMGGFNTGMGAMDEHLDEAAMQAALKQKQVSQQQASTQPASGKSGTNPLLSQTQGNQSPFVGHNQAEEKTDASKVAAGSGVNQQKPREVSTLIDEIVNRPLNDLKKGLSKFVDIQEILGIKVQDTPEQQAKKKQLHQRWQKLNSEQQEVAQKNFQQAMQKKKAEQEAQEKKKQQEQQQQQQSIALPSSPKKGPIGPASGMSKKKNATEMLQQQRKGLGSVGQKH